MYSIRTAFLRNSQNHFYSSSQFLGLLGSTMGTLNQEKQQVILNHSNKNSLQKTTLKCFNINLFQYSWVYFSRFKLLARQINYHINSFSQLSNREMGDFKDCEDLVHILQVDEEQFRLCSLESVYSNYEPLSTTQEQSQYNDASQVQDLAQLETYAQSNYD